MFSVNCQRLPWPEDGWVEAICGADMDDWEDAKSNGGPAVREGLITKKWAEGHKVNAWQFVFKFIPIIAANFPQTKVTFCSLTVDPSIQSVSWLTHASRDCFLK